MRARSMTEGRPVRLLLAVALPLMAGNIFQQLYTVVDAQIVGKVEGVQALAALGVVDWFNWLCVAVIQGFAQGFTIPVAQAYGGRRMDRLRRYVGNSIVLAAITAAILTVSGLLLISPVLKLLDTPTEIVHLSRRYLLILFSAFPVAMAYNLMAGILRSLGDGKSPLYAMVVASITNIGLDLLFVAVFRWGVVGAAVATVIAQVCSCIYCLHRLRRLDFVRPARCDLRPDGKVCAQLIKLSLPVAAQNAVIGVGGMAVQRVVNTLSVAFIAGYTAAGKFYGVLEIAAISYGYAVATYTGQNLGAGKWERVKKGVHSAVGLGVITSIVIAAVIFIIGRAVLGSFISGTPEEVAEATNVACQLIYLQAACLSTLYILYVYRSALQGMGDTVMPMVSGLVELVMRIGCAWLLLDVIGYWSIFWAEIAAWVGADLILVPSYYLRLRKKK